MMWAGHMVLIGDKRSAYRVLVGNLSKGEPLEGLGVDGRIIFKLILNKGDEKSWTGLMCLRIGKGGVYL
jgi:hypothetical protein